MRITVHTPRMHVEEWDLPTLRPGDTDATALAIVAGMPGRADPAHRLAEYEVANGEPYVHSRADDDLEVVGRRLATARTVEQTALDEARLVALRRLADGVSEREVAAALGVDRSLVRTWRGKRGAKAGAELAALHRV